MKKRIIVIGAVAVVIAGALGILKRLRDIPETPMTGDNEEYYKKYPIFARIYYLISCIPDFFQKILSK